MKEDENCVNGDYKQLQRLWERLHKYCVNDYTKYLQGKYSYMNTGTTSMQGVPTTVSVSGVFLKKCMNDPEKAKYLEENLAAIPDSVKSLCNSVKMAPGSPDAPEMQLKQLRESQKAFKKEQKNQRKEAKKRAKELENQERELDEQIDGTNASVVVVTLFIIVIWLGILCLLVKMDVGGFGSNVLTPMLKDIPVINKILPTENGLESPKEKAYGGYNSIKDAVDYASELEKKLEQAQSTNTAYSEQIEALKAEVKRLQTFEDNQVNFQRIKEQFYEEVVYADNGPGAEEYRAYYEEMDPTTAEALYKQVIQEEAVNNKMKDYVATYSNMDAKKAAGILGAMTDNLDLAANILMNLPASTRGAIMGEMDAAVAARISRIMNPGN